MVDLPPGTGDISLSLAQFLPRAEVYVVTTPQPAAQRVAQRAAFMADTVNLEVKGVIENMSWFTGDDGKRYSPLWRRWRQGTRRAARGALAGQCSAHSGSARRRRFGNPLVATDPESEAGAIFAAMAETIDVELAPTRRYNAELKIL